MKSEKSIFLLIEKLITEALAEIHGAGKLNDEQIEAGVLAAMELSAEEIYNALQRGSKAKLKRERENRRTFEKQNLKRWQAAFDQIEILWQVAQEIGSEFNSKFRAEAAAQDNHVFEALVRLHGRGMLVAAEAIHLMKGGFADGALSRWRTLHELFVVATFLKKTERLPACAGRFVVKG